MTASKKEPRKHDKPVTDQQPGNLRLTPSEIESLRTHKQQVSAQARGRFTHLFKK